MIFKLLVLNALFACVVGAFRQTTTKCDLVTVAVDLWLVGSMFELFCLLVYLLVS